MARKLSLVECVIRGPLLTFALVAIGCGSSGPSFPVEMPDAGESAVSTLTADLRRAGASVAELGVFSTDPLGGRGVQLCVAGQQVRAYVFPTHEEATALARAIDPGDPSKIGQGLIVEWAGNPKFWQRGSVIVSYLGSDAATEADLTTVLGPPFASGLGRDPGAAAHRC
jgi:hypothetical protein